MSRRSRAREVALQSLYQLDLAGEQQPGRPIGWRPSTAFTAAGSESRPLVEFADGLVAGVLASARTNRRT